METSKKYSLNSADFGHWIKNALLFLAPVGVIYLAFVQGNLGDGISISDFVPDAIVMGAVILYAINTVLDLLRKFLAGPAIV